MFNLSKLKEKMMQFTTGSYPYFVFWSVFTVVSILVGGGLVYYMHAILKVLETIASKL